MRVVLDVNRLGWDVDACSLLAIDGLHGSGDRQFPF
jgi:hypothetical protein